MTIEPAPEPDLPSAPLDDDQCPVKAAGSWGWQTNWHMAWQRLPARLPVAPLLLIVLGTFFLLANFDLVRIETILRFWPIALIGFGVYLLMGRVKSHRP